MSRESAAKRRAVKTEVGTHSGFTLCKLKWPENVISEYNFLRHAEATREEYLAALNELVGEVSYGEVTDWAEAMRRGAGITVIDRDVPVLV